MADSRRLRASHLTTRDPILDTHPLRPADDHHGDVVLQRAVTDEVENDRLDGVRDLVGGLSVKLGSESAKPGAAELFTPEVLGLGHSIGEQCEGLARLEGHFVIPIVRAREHCEEQVRVALLVRVGPAVVDRWGMPGVCVDDTSGGRFESADEDGDES